MLVVTKDFRQQVGTTFLPFEAGAVIENQDLETELLRTNAPVVLVESKDDLIQCPHCRRKFTITLAVAKEDKSASNVRTKV